jgi:hypothetical protein
MGSDINMNGLDLGYPPGETSLRSVGMDRSGTPPQEVAQNLGIWVPTIYRWLPASSRN